MPGPNPWDIQCQGPHIQGPDTVPGTSYPGSRYSVQDGVKNGVQNSVQDGVKNGVQNSGIWDPNSGIWDPNSGIWDPNSGIWDPNEVKTV